MESSSEDIFLKQAVKIENVMDDWQYGQQYNSGASSDVADPRKDPILGTTATKAEHGTSETEKDPASIIGAVKTEPGTCEKDPASSSIVAAVKTEPGTCEKDPASSSIVAAVKTEPGTCEKDPASSSIVAAVKTEPDTDTLLNPGESPDRTVSYSHVNEDVRVKCEEKAEEKLGHNSLLARDRIGNCDDSSQSKKSIKLESDDTEILPFCKQESSVSASAADSKQQDADISQVCKQESSAFIPAAYSKELVNNNNIRLSPPHTVACSDYSLLTAKPVSVAEPASLMPVVHSHISQVSLLNNHAQVSRDRNETSCTGDQLREAQTVWTVKTTSACATTVPKQSASVKSSSSTTAKTSKQKQPVVLLVDSQYGLCVADQRLADKLCQKGQDPASANKLITADPIRVSYVTGKATVNNSTPGKKDSVVMVKAGVSEDKNTNKGSPAPAVETFLVQMPGQSNKHSAPSSIHPPRSVQTLQTNFLVQMPGQSIEHNVSSSHQQPKSSMQISQQQLLKISDAISAVRKIQQKQDHAGTAYEKFLVNFSTGTAVQGIEKTAVAKHKPSILQRPALSGSELLLKTQHSSSGTLKDSGKSLLKSARIAKDLSKSGQISSTPQRSTSTPQGNWTSRQKVTSPISSRSAFVTTDGAANTNNTGVNSQQVSSRGSAQSDKVQAAKQTFEACLECFSFIPVSQMQKHVTACHPQGVSVVYKCPSCPAVFKSLSAQEQHTKQHTMQSMQENIEIVDDNCDAETNMTLTDDGSDESSQEDESIQDDDNADASEDEKAEENPQDIDVSQAEEENSAEEEQFFCCVCGRGYPTSERWMRHRLSKHPQVRHLDCEICGEFYKISGTGPESGKRRKLSGSFCSICQTDVNENLILHIQREHEQAEPNSSDTDTTSSDGEIDNDTDSEYGDESVKKTDNKKTDNAARNNSNDKEKADGLQESRSQLEGEHKHDKSKPSVSVCEDSTASNVKPASCCENKSLTVTVTTSNTQNAEQKRAQDNSETDTTGNSSGDAARQAKARVNVAVYRCPLCGSAFPQTTELLQHMGTHAGYGEYIQRCATAYAE